MKIYERKYMLFLGGIAVMASLFSITSASGAEQMKLDAVDIAPFALPNLETGEVWFEEPRDVVRLKVTFRTEAPKEIGISYWRKVWPETRIDEVAKGHPGEFGWIHQDDWFNGGWEKAAINPAKEGARSLMVEFKGLKEEEAGFKDYNVSFRRTLALRVDVPDPAAIEGIQVFTASEPTQTSLRVQLDADVDTSATKIDITGYNAVIKEISDAVNAKVSEKQVLPSHEGPCAFTVSVLHMKPCHPYSGDDGHVMFILDDDAFTISLSSLEEEGPIWFADRGIFITRGDDSTTFEQYRERNANARTLSQLVLERPEQSLAGAYNGQPRPHVDNFNLGCSHAAQRFWLESNGDILLHKTNITQIPGKNVDRFKNDGAARLFFGLEKWAILSRYPDPAPVVAYTILARRDTITVEQKSLAVPLLTSLKKGDWAGDDPMATLLRFRFTNDGDSVARAELPITYSQDSSRTATGPTPRDGHSDYGVPQSALEELFVSADTVSSDWNGQRVLRCMVQSAMDIRKEGNGIIVSRELQPGESCEALIKIPYISLEEEKELDALRDLDFDRCHAEVAAYWRRVGAQGASVHAPEPQLAALHASHVSHVLVADTLMPDGSGLVNTSVGTSTYGNFSNEACMIVHDLDQRGLHDEAEKRLGIWIKYQGTAEQPGNFTDYNGMYYGAGGYECGSYNQHHGWVLWCLCEHFFLSHDEAWFRSVADSVIAGADWVFRQRRNTMTELPHSRGWEYGFLPAGSLEDVTDFYYWLSTNSLTWRGTEWAARALEAINHPDALRVRTEADAYKRDLVRGFETMRQHTPLVRLNDGRWVPDYPSRLYRRGREVGWIREVLEGSVYLLISGLYDASSPQAQWILDDFQDNRYSEPPYGYFIPDYEMTWYDRAGISMQPNLLAGLMPYLMRDEPEMYIWMFYNAWSSCYREEANAMVEHPLPVLGWSNHVLVKTSDEANATSWLRAMLVYAAEDLLHVGRAIPRAWFGQNDMFGAKGVETPFGAVSVEYAAGRSNSTCKASVQFDAVRAPQRFLIRFRDSEGREMRAATVNGRAYPVFDGKKGDIDITGLSGDIEIEAQY